MEADKKPDQCGLFMTQYTIVYGSTELNQI